MIVMRRSATAILLMFFASVSQAGEYEFRLKDADTAIKIAKAVLEQDFGKAELRKMKSFEAKLTGDKWIVYLHPYKHNETPRHGGSWDVVIAVDRATILSITAEM